MGRMNLLKANWTGKVGETVGAKWKNLSTIRAYTKPAYTNTPAQQTVRGVFGDMTKFVYLFTDQLKSLSPLNTKGMSVRNAIVQLNKDQFEAGTFDKAALKISRGGLLSVSNFACVMTNSSGKAACTWQKSISATVTAKSKIIVIVVDETNKQAFVGTALQSAQSVDITMPVTAARVYDVYYYIIDYRGSAKVGSQSAYLPVTAT